MHVNEAHNGYLEMYLNLGWVGVALLAAILVTAYKRAVAAFRWNPEIGALMLAFVAGAVVYSGTEAGFRMLNPIWICLLLAQVGAVGMAGTAGRASQPLRIPAGQVSDSTLDQNAAESLWWNGR